MDLGLSLNLEQKQELVMTPQLQMAIELLQFSSQELEDYVDEELKNNPLLEKDKDEKGEELDERIANQYSSPSYTSAVSNKNDENNYENFVSYEPNLLEHLENQLYQVLSDEEMEIGKYILGNLDQSGFLAVSPEKISENLDCSLEKVIDIKEKINYLDPVGVAACNLKESLLIQLDNLMINTKTAEKVVKNCFDYLVEKDFDKIMKKVEKDEDKVLGAINLIKTLNPRPAAAFNEKHNTKYITPDIVIKKVNDDFVVVINEKASPILRINPQYYKMMQKSRGDDTHDFLKKKFKSALWLIKSIEQRRITVYRIAQAIVEKQEEFLRKGIKYVKPMTMQDIADEIEMHESTVSRATSEKYIQTPQGIYDFKFFFSSGVNNVSSISIKAMIREYIENEDKDSPLSDSKLAEELKEKEGMKLSRRTIAKYRNEMGIPSSLKRKKKYI
ncbi:MAG: RNA polymerase factor sigma-54 [Bacillota bacterium]